MPSQARSNLDANITDIYRLMDMYETVKLIITDPDLNENEDERKFDKGYDVALRSAFLLLVTYWEAYIEDICQEAIKHITDNSNDPCALPKQLRKTIADELKKDKHELAVWRLAKDGWKQILKKNQERYASERNWDFKTPSSNQTRIFFSKSLGIADITERWPKITDEINSETLIDAIVRKRGEIAHRGTVTPPLTIEAIRDAREFISILASKTGGTVSDYCKSITNEPLISRKGKNSARKRQDTEALLMKMTKHIWPQTTMEGKRSAM